MDFNLTLTYDYRNNLWIAKCDDFAVKAGDLTELDKKIANELRKKGYKGRVKLRMQFDYYTIPEWMRQFHPHYFDRIVEIDV
jgi:hypothetical protein